MNGNTIWADRLCILLLLTVGIGSRRRKKKHCTGGTTFRLGKMAHSADIPLGLAVSKPPVAELPYLKPAHQQLKATARYHSAKVELEPALLLELKVTTILIRGIAR
jgi:hypothetical protein